MTELSETIESLVHRFIEEGKQKGIQVAVWRDGEWLVDIAAGTADEANRVEVTRDTLFPVFSVTKGITATLLHVLAERYGVDYDLPIAEVWPDFARKDKQGITIRHALTHTSGLATLPAGLTPEKATDWGCMCGVLEGMDPEHAPGRSILYHAVSFSWTVGEVIRRIGGLPFTELLDREIKVPLGISSLFIGMPPELDAPIAWLDEPGAEAGPFEDVPGAVPAGMKPLSRWMNERGARLACMPGCNGMMSARAIATHYAATMPGGIRGVELLSSERRRQASIPFQPWEPNPGPGRVSGLGYVLDGEKGPNGDVPIYGHGGHGGSTGFVDMKYGFAFAMTRNRFNEHDCRTPIVDAVRAALGPRST